MGKNNCWEFKRCGREPGGANVEKFGLCPITTLNSANGLNDGVNGGRICWVISDVVYKNNVKCSERHRKHECFTCEFRYKVVLEEGFMNVCKDTGFFINSSLTQ